jgi:phosphatidylglycerophosphate synthase
MADDSTKPEHVGSSAQTPVNVSKKHGDVYAAGERAWMERTQEIRARLFLPLMKLLVALKVTPNYLTFISFCCGIAACYVYMVNPFWAFVLIFLHVFIDGLDGPLARYQKIDSPKGSFTDSMSDNAVVAATTILFMWLGKLGVLVGSLYILAYTLVVLFAMARNYMHVPYHWLVRPRFYVFGWMVVETYWWPGTLAYVMWICVALLLWKSVSGFMAIRDKL